jgi:hypothetical protein
MALFHRDPDARSAVVVDAPLPVSGPGFLQQSAAAQPSRRAECRKPLFFPSETHAA